MWFSVSVAIEHEVAFVKHASIFMLHIFVFSFVLVHYRKLALYFIMHNKTIRNKPRQSQKASHLLGYHGNLCDNPILGYHATLSEFRDRCDSAAFTL